MVSKRTQHERLVHMTSVHKHSFRIHQFLGWLKILSDSLESAEVKTLGILFVVEQDKLSAFEFTTVEVDSCYRSVGRKGRRLN
ncbi:hypothetical protein F444_03986 [Phytophthora nicotianae P1976]|uniref:Uncharacterized protein n=2 Tax=Phytophthora nicotianae TaxID=4792 RepID=A0A081ASA7_PHYNI|nr:hypothetical protein F444_03986 [Phytophthora nicotianae P1976]